MKNMKDFVLKHIKDDSMKEYKICIIFENDRFELLIFQPSNAWRAELSQDALSILASQLNMDPEEYFSKIKQYLPDTPEDMHFKITNKEFIMYHKLKNNIKMKFFLCPLEKVNYSHYMEKLLALYYDELKGYKEKYDLTMKDLDELEGSKQVLERKLQEFVRRKNTDDEVLYSNFVLLLNEKKRQIQHLNQMLQAFKRGRPTQNPSIGVKWGGKCVVKEEMLIAKKEVSDSDTEDEPSIYNTDDDENHLKSEVTRHNEIGNLPSTSKQDFSLFLEDSPPHHILPKRQRITQSMESNIQPIVPVLNLHAEKQESSTATKRESPVDSNFNTQDLLDLL